MPTPTFSGLSAIPDPFLCPKTVLFSMAHCCLIINKKYLIFFNISVLSGALLLVWTAGTSLLYSAIFLSGPVDSIYAVFSTTTTVGYADTEHEVSYTVLYYQKKFRLEMLLLGRQSPNF